MKDEDIIDYFVNKERCAIISGRINKHAILKVPEMVEYLNNRYSEPFDSYCEVVARIYHNISERPKCKVCGKELKYYTFKEPYRSGKWCSTTCQLKDEEFIKERTQKMDYDSINKKRQETLLEKYGDKFYRNHKKGRQTLLERYGCDSPFKGVLRQRMEERLFKENGKRTRTNVEKIRQTKQERYGDPTYTNKEQIRKTMIERYGVPTTLESNELRDKVKKTKLLRYGDPNFSNTEKAQRTVFERYGKTQGELLDERRKMINYEMVMESKKNNGTLNSSKQEIRMFNILTEIFGEENVIQQYSDDRYVDIETSRPYICDFYVKSCDLFIELQGHYTHGPHPFDETNEDDIKFKDKLEEQAPFKPSLKVTLDVWCRRDVNKRCVAKTHGLNYMEIFGSKFSKESVMEQLKDYL